MHFAAVKERGDSFFFVSVLAPNHRLNAGNSLAKKYRALRYVKAELARVQEEYEANRKAKVCACVRVCVRVFLLRWFRLLLLVLRSRAFDLRVTCCCHVRPRAIAMRC